MKFSKPNLSKKVWYLAMGRCADLTERPSDTLKVYVALREEVICKRLLQNPFCSKYRGSLHIISIGMCQSSKNQLMY